MIAFDGGFDRRRQRGGHESRGGSWGEARADRRPEIVKVLILQCIVRTESEQSERLRRTSPTKQRNEDLGRISANISANFLVHHVDLVEHHVPQTAQRERGHLRVDVRAYPAGGANEQFEAVVGALALRGPAVLARHDGGAEGDAARRERFRHAEHLWQVSESQYVGGAHART